MTDLEIARNLAVAALVGLAVGLEREWSGHARGPGARFAGIRTFFILGVIGGIAGLMRQLDAMPFGIALIAGTGALTVTAYLLAARRRVAEAIDGTTEAAAFLVLGLGALAGLGLVTIASALGAVTVLALSEKRTIRSFVSRIGEAEMRGAFQFAVLALVVLPLLPEGPYGPYDAIRPRTLWMIVLIISAVNYIGYLVRKAFGGARGYLVTGALGGLVSSTAVTFAFARASRTEPEHGAALGRGTIAACLVLIPRVVTLAIVLNPTFGPRVAFVILPVLALGLLALLRRSKKDVGGAERDEVRNPLQLFSALKLAVAFQLVLLGIEFARSVFGDIGVFAGAAVAGLTDVDALTLTMSRLARDDGMHVTAIRGLMVGVLANTLLKSGVAAGLGAPSYRRWALPGLLAMAVGCGVAIYLAGL